MTLDDHISAVAAAIGDARQGLPEAVFRLLGRITPMVNVDLLIGNDRGETLLTWRQDDLYLGWHLPGGVVRFQERMAHRVAEVARLELAATVSLTPDPIAIHEILDPARTARGHFISFLFECRLTSDLDDALRHRGGTPATGEWAWHASPPPDLLAVHDIYRRFIGARR
jgi:ADP-ribose pyrophosphatase YjhB (NUDIX family)